MTPSEEKILEFAKQIKYFRSSQIANSTNIPINTIKKSINSLVEKGKLKRFNNWTYEYIEEEV